MATPRRLGAFALALVTTLTLTSLHVVGAQAEPTPTPAQARQELARLDAEMDDAVEEYNQARIDLTKAQRRYAMARAAVVRAEAAVAGARRGIGEFAAAAYMSGGGTNDMVALMTGSSPQTFLDKASTLDAIARNQAGQLRAVKAAAHRVKSAEAVAAQALAAQRQVEHRLAAVRGTIDAKVARQRTLLAVVDARAARSAEARPPRASRSAPRAAQAYSGPASGRARIAVAEAHRQLGKPYKWGAAGPDSFDCSGLMMWVWGKAGVSLPHSSRAQYNEGSHVSRAELAPGDLVFYGNPIHHVGIYVGGGRYIAAPQTGDVVRFREVDRPDYTGAVRL